MTARATEFVPRASSGRGKTKTTPAAKIHGAPKAKAAPKRTKNDEARDLLAELGLDPIRELALLSKDEKVPPSIRARCLEELLPYVMPREKPVSAELEELRARMETQIRFVILGENEDLSPAGWEARNAHFREWLAAKQAALEPALTDGAGTVQ